MRSNHHFWVMCGFDPVKYDSLRKYSIEKYYLYKEANKMQAELEEANKQ